MNITKLGIFCGSNTGVDPAYVNAAIDLGKLLAKEGIELIYGGGKVGMMGTIADAVLKAGGKATGVIPDFLIKKEVGHAGLTTLKVVSSMHERKLEMARLSDGFIALPGGFGTFEEIFEAITWTQLALHQKPCAFLNTKGFYNPVVELIEKATTEEFIRADNAKIVLVSDDSKALLKQMREWTPPQLPKWI